MDLLLIRHGKPGRGSALDNESGADPGLTDEGHTQSARLAEFLAGTHIDAIYSSPMRRARETAQHLAAKHGLPIRLDEGLYEFDRGAANYVPAEELTDDPQARWEGLLEGRWGDHVFDLDAFQDTVCAAIEHIIGDHPARTVAVVCHSGVVNAYLARVIGTARPMFFQPGYTALSRVLAARSGRRELLTANETCHLHPVRPIEAGRGAPVASAAAVTETRVPAGGPPMTTTPAQDELRLVTLHALRLKSFATVQWVAGLLEAEPGALEAVLAAAAEDGHVAERSGRLSGWTLTPAGRLEHARLLAEDLAARGCRDAVERAYEEFTELNQPFKQVCTDWQLRTTSEGADTVNDHTDDDYDAKVIRRLGDLHERVVALTDALSRSLPRFSWYHKRFHAAWRRLADGDTKAFAAPMSDSYHDVWMELHQDFLSTLGRTRSAKDGH